MSKDPKDLHNPIARMGHPNDPHLGELLSADEEKRVDAEGRKVVEGLSWSEATTGMYLVIAASNLSFEVDRPLKGFKSALVPDTNTRLTVGVSDGLPVVTSQQAFGVCLEIPSDLGRDRIKQGYFAEWIAETAVESLAGTGVHLNDDREEAGIGSRMSRVGLWVAKSAQDALVAAGI